MTRECQAPSPATLILWSDSDSPDRQDPTPLAIDEVNSEQHFGMAK
jgi:hypothetical protein